MKKRNGVYRYDGYSAFKVMAELHQQLWPEQKEINRNSRRAKQIFEALSKAYTDGIEDAVQMEDSELSKLRRKIFWPAREIDI